MIFRLGYNIGVQLYGLMVQLASLWSVKAKKWVHGRKNQQIPAFESAPLWFHVSSLGEFEQARPVIEEIKSISPSTPIALSFFSPSGYEIRKNYELADGVFYLPLDSPANVKKILGKVQPRAIVFTKYDLWFNLIEQSLDADIPLYLISGVFRENQYYFKWYGRPFIRLLRRFKHIFLQEGDSGNLLEKFGFDNFSVSGDTRVDRVKELQSIPFNSEEKLQTFIGDRKTMIVGSSWPVDESLLFPYVLNYSNLKDWCFIIAPHDVSDKRIKSLKSSLGAEVCLLSQEIIKSDRRILVVDSIGVLNKLYRLGNLSYIGGGFGQGIHNTLEPAAAGLPVVFGPKYQKFAEAKLMVKHGFAFSVKDQNDLESVINSVLEGNKIQEISSGLQDMIDELSGATEEIIDLWLQHEVFTRST